MFKFERDEYDKCWYLYLSENTFVHLINDWGKIFGKWNWYSFHILHVYVENDLMFPGFEFEFVVMGLGFRFRINRSWRETEIGQRLDQLNQKLKVNGPKTLKQLKRSSKSK